MIYPNLKTDRPELELQPFSEKHVSFLVSLINSPSVNKTLFRTATKTTTEKQQLNREKMYDGKKPKEITYVLVIKKLLSQTPIGFVKIKLIDWDVMSCYLSTALVDDPNFRGKGYAKTAYDAFFSYLFSLGFQKIYGRTYEINDTTIALNEATRFKFVGRQEEFLTYPDKTFLDALLFVRINEKANATLRSKYAEEMDNFSKISSESTMNKQSLKTLLSGLESAQYYGSTFKKYADYIKNEMLAEIPIVVPPINATYTEKISTATLITILELAHITVTFTNNPQNENFTLTFNPLALSGPSQMAFSEAVYLAVLFCRYQNARHSRSAFLGIPITIDQYKTAAYLAEQIFKIATGDPSWNAFNLHLLYGNSLTAKTIPYLSRYFLGRTLSFDFMKILTIANEITKAAKTDKS